MNSHMDFSKDLTKKCNFTQASLMSSNSIYNPFEQTQSSVTSLPGLRDLGILDLVQVGDYSFKDSTGKSGNHNSSEPMGLSEDLLSDELRSANQRRRRVSTHQKDMLNRIFRQSFFPSTELRTRLAQELDMTPRAVQIWFQNKRQAWRAKNKMTSHTLVAPQYMRNSLAFSHRGYGPLPVYPYSTIPFYASKPSFYPSYNNYSR